MEDRRWRIEDGGSKMGGSKMEDGAYKIEDMAHFPFSISHFPFVICYWPGRGMPFVSVSLTVFILLSGVSGSISVCDQ